MLGLDASAAGQIKLTNCDIPANAMLGERGQAFAYVQSGLNRERLFGGLACVSWRNTRSTRPLDTCKDDPHSEPPSTDSGHPPPGCRMTPDWKRPGSLTTTLSWLVAGANVTKESA